ncbi:uncharacterized protein LOC123509414 [Portunus trituberculatus]|uniref:uncharacterized protein LOC123509414 n=1 Tax=Portunus trituberculatus TaxID=210409 RepID=UPI001E1CFE74|nr:uncharacterized protein LOC123509414 [Portunus trituberculatus]
MIFPTTRMGPLAVMVVVALLAPHTSATPFRFGSKKRDQTDPSSSPSPIPPPPAFPATDAGLGGLGSKGDTGVLLPPVGAGTGLGGGKGGLGLGGAGENGFFTVVDGIDDGIDVLIDGGLGLGAAGGLDPANTLFVKEEAVQDNLFSKTSQEITALVPASTTSIFNRAGQRTPCMRVYRLAKNLKGSLFRRGNRSGRGGNRGGRGRRFGEEVLGRILCLIPDSLRASRRG